MQTILGRALIGLAMVSGTPTFAAALFDPATGTLTLPTVRVDNTTFADVRLALVNAGNFTFRLQNNPGLATSAEEGITFDSATGMLTIPFVSVGALAYSVQLRLVDAASYTFTLSTATVVPTGSKLYIGYYVEDPTNNPEDPTIGSLLVSFPSADAAFSGLMPFSYAGCTGQADIGTVKGTRAGAAVNGSWTGKIDQVAAGGAYTGSYDVAKDTYAGNYTNAGGKVPFGNGACGGFIASHGTWKAFGTTTNQPANFALQASAGVAPQLSWPSVGAALYTVRMFDEACLMANAQSASCFIGEAYTFGTNLSYPAQFQSASPMASGRKYIALIGAQDASTGALLGFSSLRITP